MTFEDFTTWAELVQYLAVLVTAYIAIRGINAWRKEAKWKREFQLCEEVLALFYEMQDVMNELRHPFSYAGELPEEDDKPRNAEDPKSTLHQVQLLRARYEKHQESFATLKAMKYRFMTVFGVDAKKPFEELNRIVGEVFSAAHMLETYYWKKLGKNNLEDEKFQSFLEKMHNYEDLIWAKFDDTDVVNGRIKGIVEEVESYAAPIIQKK